MNPPIKTPSSFVDPLIDLVGEVEVENDMAFVTAAREGAPLPEPVKKRGRPLGSKNRVVAPGETPKKHYPLPPPVPRTPHVPVPPMISDDDLVSEEELERPNDIVPEPILPEYEEPVEELGPAFLPGTRIIIGEPPTPTPPQDITPVPPPPVVPVIPDVVVPVDSLETGLAIRDVPPPPAAVPRREDNLLEHSLSQEIESENTIKSVSKELFNRQNIDLKTEVSHDEINDLTRLRFLEDRFGIDNVAVLSNSLLSLRVSKGRKSREEFVTTVSAEKRQETSMVSRLFGGGNQNPV